MDLSRLPPDHTVYLQQRPFAFGCSTDMFPPEELAVLSEHGNWMQALATGLLQPVNGEQEHFLAVYREETEPVTVWERAWVRLKGRREYEEGQSRVASSSPSEDYGMVEWDADRCWW